MVVQVLTPPQQRDTAAHLSNTINQLGQFFLQTAAFRQSVKADQQMHQYRQQQMAMQQKRDAFARQQAMLPKDPETAFMRGQIDESQLRTIKQAGRTPSYTEMLDTAASGFAAKHGLAQGKDIPVDVLEQIPPAVQKRFVYSYEGGSAKWGQKPETKPSPKARISTSEKPIYTKHPYTKEKVTVPEGLTIAQWRDDLRADKELEFSQTLARDKEDRIGDELGEAIDFVNKGELSAAQSQIGKWTSQIGSLRKELAGMGDIDRSINSGKVSRLTAEIKMLENAVAKTEAGIHQNRAMLVESKRLRNVAKSHIKQGKTVEEITILMQEDVQKLPPNAIRELWSWINSQIGPATESK